MELVFKLGVMEKDDAIFIRVQDAKIFSMMNDISSDNICGSPSSGERSSEYPVACGAMMDV